MVVQGCRDSYRTTTLMGPKEGVGAQALTDVPSSIVHGYCATYVLKIYVYEA